VIEVSVPVRICDNGGWTDTWFGGPGRVLNIAIKPGVNVSIRRAPGRGEVVLDVEGSDPYVVQPRQPRAPRHALVEAAIDAFPPPADAVVEVEVRSAVPPGCGAGTSAAVAVAVLGGLAAVRSEPISPREIAYAAHRLEVEVLGLESGIQDQLSAAYGGINYLEIDTYPDATVQQLPDWDELEAALTLVYLGRAHVSSAVHRQVIEGVRRPEPADALARLRTAAVAARDAVLARDLYAFGHAMIANTDAQRALHPLLVGTDAAGIIEFARRQGAIGWKVNGAGGDGGSVTILSRGSDAKAEFERRVSRLDRRVRVLALEIATAGLTVAGQPATSTADRSATTTSAP